MNEPAHQSRVRLPALTTTGTLSETQVRSLFALADEYHQGRRTRVADGSVLGTMFVQPSTRTRVSFEAAMLRLGGMVTGFAELESTRAADCFGESLDDVLRVLGSVVDVVAIRHPENGSAERAATLLDVPVINAGDGTNEHPTQALSDVRLMAQALGGLDGRVIGLGGQLDNRAYHSIVPLLGMFGVRRVPLLPPPNTGVPRRLATLLDQHGLPFESCSTMEEFVEASDLVELVPMFLPDYNQAFSAELDADDATIPDTHILNRAVLERTGRTIPILHPGPRTAELSTDLDELPNFLFFPQVAHGVSMRMAVLHALLRESRERASSS